MLSLFHKEHMQFAWGKLFMSTETRALGVIMKHYTFLGLSSQHDTCTVTEKQLVCLSAV